MHFGNATGRDPLATVGFTSNYISPITSTCTNNYQIILTDGRPTWDSQADIRIGGLTGTACDGPEPGDPGNTPAPVVTPIEAKPATAAASTTWPVTCTTRTRTSSSTRCPATSK